MKLVYNGDIYSYSSQAIRNRNVLQVLEKTELYHMVTVPWGCIDEGRKWEFGNIILGMEKRDASNPVVYVRNNLPFYPAGMYAPELNWHTMYGRLKVGVIQWENSAILPEWKEYTNYADIILVPTERQKEVLTTSGIGGEKIYVAENGFHDRIFGAHVLPLGTKGKGFKFLHFGSSDLKKGTRLLIDAFDEAFTDRDDVSLTIHCANGPVDGSRSRSTNLPEIIFESEFIPEPLMGGYYKSFNCLVYPSLMSKSCLNLIEAAVSNLPIISTDKGNLRALISEDRAILVESDISFMHYLVEGYGFKPKHESLVEALRIAYTKPDVLKSKAERAYGDLKDKTWKNVVLKTNETLKGRIK